MLLAKVEQYAAAARQFSQAKGEGTDAYDTGFNLALAQFKAGNNAGAVAAGDELIARGLAKVELYSLMAKAYEAAGKTKEAYEVVARSDAVGPARRNSVPRSDCAVRGA